MSIDHITAENLSFELKVGVALLEGPATLSELAARLRVTKRETSRGLDHLEDQGQIKERWTKRGDWYRKEVLLCEVAVPFFEKIKQHVERNP